VAEAAAIVTPRAIVRGVSVAASLLALAGCVPVFVATPPLGGYPAVDPIDLEVGLILGDELRAVQVRPLASDGHEGPGFDLGSALAQSAEGVCRAVFTEVVVGVGETPKGVDLVVFPRVVSVRTTRPVWFWDDVPLTMVLEWKVVTPRERLIWFETIRGTASEWAGFSFPGSQVNQLVKRLDALFQELFLQSHAALAGSPEIRAYAAQVALAEGAE
jgi:hypothetical protein